MQAPVAALEVVEHVRGAVPPRDGRVRVDGRLHVLFGCVGLVGPAVDLAAWGEAVEFMGID